MDKKDMRILSVLSANSKETYRNIAKEVELSKDAVKYRIEKLVATGVITRFRAVVDVSEFKLNKYDILFRFSDERELIKTIQELTKYDKVTWIARLFGTYDLRITYIAKNYDELHNAMLSLKTNAEMTVCKIEKQQKKDSEQLNRLLLGVSSKRQEKKYNKKPYELDAIDKGIINELINNARITNNEIAKKLNTTQDIIHYRIKKLEKTNTIQKYTIDIDTATIGKIWCITLIKIKHIDENIIEKLNAFISSKNVSTYAMLTGEWNLSIAFFGNSMQDIYEIFKEIRSQLASNIISVEPLIVTERYGKNQKLL